MAENIINALPRSDHGKGAARQLRLHGRVPGVFYLGAEANFGISIDNMELTRLLRDHHTLLKLCVGDEAPRECVIREIQRDPVSDKIVHIDFLGIKSDQKIIIDVPLKLTGIPVGVKSDGGILQHGVSSLAVECLPGNIPTEVVVDVSELKIGHSLYLDSVNMPDVRFMGDPKLVLATVAAPTLSRTEQAQVAADKAAEA